jgi:hypothetical protein
MNMKQECQPLGHDIWYPRINYSTCVNIKADIKPIKSTMTVEDGSSKHFYSIKETCVKGKNQI